MKRFVFAVSLAWIGVYLWNFKTGFGGRLGIQYHLLLANSLLLAPILTAGLIAIVFNYLSRPRLFQHQSSPSLTIMLQGLATGAVSVFLAMFAIAFLDRYAPDWAIVAACTALCTLLVLRFTPRRLPGTCEKCHYDIRASLNAGRCPECGLAF